MLQQAPHENSHLIDLYKLLKECFVIIDPNSSFNNLTHFIILYLTQIWLHICAFFLSILKKKEIFHNSIFDTNLTPFVLFFFLCILKKERKKKFYSLSHESWQKGEEMSMTQAFAIGKMDATKTVHCIFICHKKQIIICSFQRLLRWITISVNINFRSIHGLTDYSKTKQNKQGKSLNTSELLRISVW